MLRQLTKEQINILVTNIGDRIRLEKGIQSLGQTNNDSQENVSIYGRKTSLTENPICINIFLFCFQNQDQPPRKICKTNDEPTLLADIDIHSPHQVQQQIDLTSANLSNYPIILNV